MIITVEDLHSILGYCVRNDFDSDDVIDVEETLEIIEKENQELDDEDWFFNS